MTDPSADSLIAEWNALGRDYTTRLNALIADSYEDRETPENWPDDPRTLDQAQAVIAVVEAAERAGHWDREQPVADRAHEPFIEMLDAVGRNISCVCILGPDEVLVRLGSAWQPGPALHLRGGQVTERPGLLAAAMSRSHDLLLLVRQDGFSVSHGLDAVPVAHFSWPEAVKPQALDMVQISEDGRTIAFVGEGVWLGQAQGETMVWTCADAPLDDSMIHCGLSPDGRFLAYGSQCYGHYIDRIEGIGTMRRWAEIGRRSEYPHYACFSDDSAVVALNSCHFYHGATLGVRLAEIEGAETQDYEEDPRTTLLDDRLRVYAATWLPLGPDKESFALAGASYLDVVSVGGETRHTQYFGSSASSVDYCPKTGLLALGSYSGFLHLYDPAQAAEPDKAVGYHPMRELYRWVLWSDRPPFRW